MSVPGSSLAKLTRPRYSRVLPRERLFRALDERQHRIVWVSGPPGAGKTALISSYLQTRSVAHLWYQLDHGDADLPTFFHYLGLAVAGTAGREQPPLAHFTPEYSHGLSAFARRYFEALAARFTAPFVLVFDNYNEVPAEAALHAALRDGLAVLPPQFTAMVLSRGEPPPELARLQVNGELLQIGWEELRLTLDEVRGIAQLSKSPHASGISDEQLHQTTQGWAGGLVLLLAHRMSKSSMQSLTSANFQLLFDYFAGEVFANFDTDAQRALVASALLRKMSVRNVAALVGSAAAGELLQTLSEGNYFTFKHDHAEPIYEYHPLFRAFLLARATQMFERAEHDRLRAHAATLLEADGQIEEAAELLKAAGDASGLARLIAVHASAFIEQGRGRVIENWLADLPHELLRANPWLAYWQGICRLPLQPLEARRSLESAYALFTERNDLLGRCQAWCGIVDSLVFGLNDFKPLDSWIVEMDELQLANPTLPEAVDAAVACGMFLALMYRQPARPDIARWEQRVRQITLHDDGDLRLQVKVGTHLLIYYVWWLGAAAKAEPLINSLGVRISEDSCPPQLRVSWHAMAVPFDVAAAADPTEALARIDRVLAITAEYGIHSWDMLVLCQAAGLSAVTGRADLAASYLERMQARLSSSGTMDKATYYYALAQLRAVQGDLQSAREMAAVAVRLAEEAGAPFYSAVLRTDYGALMVGTGQREAGLALLHQSRAEAEAMHWPAIERRAYMVEARIAADEGDEALCLQLLRRSLSRVPEDGSPAQPWWPAASNVRMYAKALAHDIETQFVTQLIRRRNLQPPPNCEAPDRWPWPLKIYTLGEFRVVKDGQVVRFTGKSQRKPLELLKALIAFGGVDVNQSSLIDALWPELEGDNGQRAFETALYRLRKLLDSDTTVILKSGKLTLDARATWVDAFSIERLFHEIETSVASATVPTHVVAQWGLRLLSAYRGHFLPEESGAWVLSRRERLCNRLLNTFQTVAQPLEERKEWDAAAQCYRRALEIEPLLESFWYRLMLCHVQQKQTAEALAVYRRCSQMLTSSLGIQPSTEMQALHASLMSAATQAAPGIAASRQRKG